MRKIKLFVTLLGCFLISLSAKSASFDEVKYQDKPIHIFYEGLATMPAFLGMIDMVALPADELKIFAFHRFTQRSDLLDLKKINAIEIPVTAKEGYVIINGHKFVNEVLKILDKNPQSPVIIYTNMNNHRYLFDILLPKIDKNRIKHLHLYEDGLGELLTYANNFQKMTITDEDGKLLEDFYYGSNEKLPEYPKHSFHKAFPVTYYFFGVNEVKKDPAYAHFLNQMKEAELKDINFHEIRKNLTSNQKQMLYSLLNFDYQYYRNLFSEKAVFMYFGGFYLGGSHKIYHAEINYLKKLQEIFPKDYFLYKQHPSFSTFDRQKRKDSFKGVEFVNPQLPYEIFIIADLEPSRVAGYSSSLFYTLKDEQIISYFPHGGYERVLKKRISPSKSLSLNDYIPKEPIFYDEKVHIFNKDDFLIFIDQNNCFVYQQNSLYFCEKNKDKLSLVAKNKKFDLTKQDGVYVAQGDDFLTVKHKHWRDDLFQKEKGIYCRIAVDDCGKGELKDNTFSICWDNWGCETFVKKEDGVYYSQ